MITQKNIFIGFLVLVLIVAGITYYRYMVLEDFTYYMTEDEYPNQFDINSYTHL